jgi:hypothetical protein
MKQYIILILAAGVAACGGDDKIANNAVVPDLGTMTEAPGDWSALEQLVDRTPAESGLLQQSPITVDLNALLGADVGRFRLQMGRGSPLTRENGVLVTVGDGGAAYLVLQPGDHALEAGLKKPDGWQRYVTPGATVPTPPSVATLLAS